MVGGTLGPERCRGERLGGGGLLSAYRPGAPDLVVEIISSSDRLTEVDRKTDLWLTAGVRMVIVVNPRIQQVIAPEEKIERVKLSEFFTGKLDSREAVNNAIERLHEYLLKLLAEKLVAGTGGRFRNACTASRTSRVASIDHTCTINELWYARSLTLPWCRPLPR